MGTGSPQTQLPPPTPSPTGAAKLIQNKNPNADRDGLGSTILTGPQNLMEQERNQKKTLLGT